MDKINKKIVKVGEFKFGDGNIYVQSMLSVPANDVQGNVAQALELQRAGCDVIRVAIPELKDVKLIHALKDALDSSGGFFAAVVADVHFDYKIAVESAYAGADKIRINPSNIGNSNRIRTVVSACKSVGIPIRIGVNAGSLKKAPLNGTQKASLKGTQKPPPKSRMVQSALQNIQLLERFDFNDIIVSVKSSSVRKTIAANRELAEYVPYPLHLGVTEAGTQRMGLIKSAIGIGSLLCDGIGDSIRVSLTADPVREVEAAIDILKAVGKLPEKFRKFGGVEIISCPTCGRCKIDVLELSTELERLVAGRKFRTVKVAVMGCAVNGPGECKDADFGITGGDGEGLIFRSGEIIKKVEESKLLPALMEMLNEQYVV